MSELDDVDHRILDLLRQDGRMPASEIARQVSLSPAPVARRIARMEEEGVIQGYTAILDDGRAGYVEAFTEVRLTGSTETGELGEIVRNIPEVIDFFTIAGDPDALLRIRVKDVDHLQRVVNALRRTGKASSTKTLIVMSGWHRR